MAENSKIEWCDHTVNLWWGCAKVHTGCKNCYAEHLSDVRYKNNLWGEKSYRKRIKSAFRDLDKYQRIAFENKTFSKIFIGSMMDIFEESKPLSNPEVDSWRETNHLREDLFDRIQNHYYPNLIFLFLTKRPWNINFYDFRNWNYRENMYFGISVSDQNTYDNAGIGYARSMKAIGANVFFSVEPQVGEVDLRFSEYAKNRLPDWIIQGGESGSKKRPFDINWAYKMKNQCKKWGVPYFFKQIDKVQAIPNDLQIQQFPKT